MNRPGCGYVDNSPLRCAPSCPHTHSPYYDDDEGDGLIIRWVRFQ
jgi:hypothetical protein